MLERTNYISWDHYFMGVALLAAKRSKDPSRQVGACIVKNNKILATGYNGFPNGCSDQAFYWGKDSIAEANDTEFDERLSYNKFWYVVHAELNAILNSNLNDLHDSTIYVDLFPCNECAKSIIQAGIKEVVYMSDEDETKPSYKTAVIMFKAANVKMRKLEKTEFIEGLMRLN